MPADMELFTPGGIFAPPRGPIEREPAWIDASPHRPVAQPGTGQMPLFPESGTLPTWTKVVSGLGLMGMLYSMDHWARPTLTASKIEQKDGIWGLLQKVVDSLGAFLDHGTNYIGHEVSKGAAHAAHGPAYTIGLSADRWNQLVWNTTYNQLETEQATRRIVHHVIPSKITHAVDPVKTRVRRVETHTKKNGREITVIHTYVTHQITHVIKPRITRIERTVTKTLPARITRVERTVRKTQVRQQHDHRLTMKLITLLTVTGAVALVTKAFTRMGLNMLRCQNTKDALRDLCASPPGSGRKLGRFLRGILSGLGGFLAPLFVCQLFEAAVVLVAPLMSTVVEVVGVVGSALCDGKHSAAPPLSLNAAALPPVRNGIPL